MILNTYRTMRNIKQTILLPHPPSVVWKALTISESLERWLMPNTFDRLEEGHIFQFRTNPMPGFNGIIDCKLLDFAPKRTRVHMGGWVAQNRGAVYFDSCEWWNIA